MNDTLSDTTEELNPQAEPTAEELMPPAAEAPAEEAPEPPLPQELEYHDWGAEMAERSGSSWATWEREQAQALSQPSPALQPMAEQGAIPESGERAGASAPAPSVAQLPAELKPLDTPAPAEPEATAPPLSAEERKAQYWENALTGNPDRVPAELVARAGADDPALSPEEREYVLTSALNRSWLADSSPMSREEIEQSWPALRRELSDSLGVADDETEVFMGLSQRREDEERMKRAREIFEECYVAALRGEKTTAAEKGAEAEFSVAGGTYTSLSEAQRALQNVEWEKQLREEAVRRGEAKRAEVYSQAEQVGKALACFRYFESSSPIEQAKALLSTPELAKTLSEMERMAPEERSTLYEVALTCLPEESRTPETDSLLPAMWRSMQRGASGVKHGVIQAGGTGSAALMKLLSRLPNAEGLGETADKVDSYMRLVQEMRQVAEERAYPINLGEDAGFAEELALEVAEAVPMAVVSFCGGAGFALSAASGIGSGLAEVRQRATEGSLELQTAAGILGYGTQMAISHGFGRVGGIVLGRTLGRFGLATGMGSGSYALAALRHGGRLTREMVSGVIDNEAGELVDMATQELVAQLHGTASNIDWKDYGEEWMTIEHHMREGARNLPFFLIGSGRMGLHHFRDPKGILGEGHQLSEWGVDEETRRRIMAEPDVRRQGTMLYDALHNGTRWGGLGFLEDAARSLRLLHTDDFHAFDKAENVRDFLQLPAETEPEKARPITLPDPKTPQGMQQLVEAHAGGKMPADAARTAPLLMMVDEWHQRAYPEDIPDFPRAKELIPEDVTRIGAYGAEAEAKRSAALEKTVRYLDALSYRFLADTTTFDTLQFSGKDAASLRAETEQLRRALIGKAAEAVLVRAGGGDQAAADRVYSDFIVKHLVKNHHYGSFEAWQRFVPVSRMEEMPTQALGRRAMTRGAELRRGRYPELQRVGWVVQGVHNCVQSMVSIMPHQSDFRTAIARGMTPQEAYAHLLNRELGSRLPQADWFPKNLVEDVTDRESYAADNQRMAEMYAELTGHEPEQREGDDGRTYWRALCPDGHYTRWHDSREHCINELAATARMRYLPLGGDMHAELLAAGTGERGYDAAQVGLSTPWRYSYFDRLSNIATGEITRQWQEDATLLMPGVSTEIFRDHAGGTTNDVNPYFAEHPYTPGMWKVDERTLHSPYSIARMRFNAFWRRMLTTGELDSKAAGDFLLRQGIIDDAELRRVMAKGEVQFPKRKMSVKDFFMGKRDPRYHEGTVDIAGMHSDLAEHLSAMTSAYFLAHLSEMPLARPVREWFAMAPFRPDVPLFLREGTGRNIRNAGGHHGEDVYNKWAHQAASEQVKRDMELAGKLRRREQANAPDSLLRDELFPMLRRAIVPDQVQRTEQGWAFAGCGMEAFERVRPEFWRFIAEPGSGWSHLEPELREKIGVSAQLAEPGHDYTDGEMPPALQNLAEVLTEYPQLREYNLYPGSDSRVLHLTPDAVSVPAEHPRDDSPFDRPDHHGDGVVRNGFDLHELTEFPDFMKNDERVMPALQTLHRLRYGILNLPYADPRGIWWQGEMYGGQQGLKLAGMGDDWVAHEPLSQIRRLVAEAPAEGDGVMQFGNFSFGHRPDIETQRFGGATIYLSPKLPLSRVRLMPGEKDAVIGILRTPYVAHTFVGSPIFRGRILRNAESGSFLLHPMEYFDGQVEREYVGHMAGYRGKELIKPCLEALRERGMSDEALDASRGEESSNLEMLMYLAEDSHFNQSLEGLAPHELSADEALASTWFHAWARHEYGVDKENARLELQQISHYLSENPQRLESLYDMLEERRRRYDDNPSELWTPEVNSSRENRRYKKALRAQEHRLWRHHLHEWKQLDEEVDAIDLNNRIGKPKKYRRQ